MAELVAREPTVTAALSGGMDSIVLLELLRRVAPRCGYTLRALHVNHGLSPHAREWERFCRAHCARRRIPFEAVQVVVAGAGANLEAQARAARYRAFVRYGGAVVALAHHREDQAETLLMNLLRGAGLHGLAAMSPSRTHRIAGSFEGSGNCEDSRTVNAAEGCETSAACGTAGTGHCILIVRPLLEVARAELARYARRRRLRWIEDESNRDTRFTRNFLRLEVLPLIERRFPGAAEALARSAGHLRAAVELVEALAQADCAAAAEGDGLNVERLCSAGEARAANALRHFLAGRGEPPPSLVRTREILRQLPAARADAQPAIALERASVRRFRGRIELVPHAAARAHSAPVPWSGERSLGLDDGSRLLAMPGCGEGVSAARLEAGKVTVRRRRGGERMRMGPAGGNRALKNLLQEAAVPPWLRACMPLLYCDDVLVWAPFVGVAPAFRAAPGERAWRFCWRGTHSSPESFG